jgi:hypothetical protein
MKQTFAISILATMMLFTPWVTAYSQTAESVVSYWSESEMRESQPTIKPLEFRVVSLDVEELQALLKEAPLESDVRAKNSNSIISLPMPDGGFEEFSFVNAPIMAPELAQRFPEIQVFLGQGIDSPSSTVRFDFTPQGFHAMILSEGETVYIDPYSSGDLTRCISYNKSSFYSNNSSTWECGVEDLEENNSKVSTPKALGKEVLQMGMPKSQSIVAHGSILRIYRLALACTGEYASFHGGTTSGALSAMNTTMARVNGVFERDVCLRMVIVANNDDIIYLNSSSDPYTNSSGSTMLSQNQTTCNNVIGSSNYDIGHVFSTGGGGIASLQSPCSSSSKARGVTGRYSPVGDPFDIDYVAHEIGHQWGANHTQNNSCNRASSAAYEPGSASTIMGYAGICSPNLQSNSDDHFHNKSINEMIIFTVSGGGNNCDSPSATGNSIPTVDAGIGGMYIPANTPFELIASASDADGDALTYNWEQYDLGPATSSSDYNLTNPSGNQPIFRSWSSSSSRTRVFPRLSDLVSNSTTIGEHLPTYTRALQFKCSVRDNVAGGGAFRDDAVSFNVYGYAGPFLVTSPSGGSLQGGSEVEVVWDVAGTGDYPINCSNVEILLSIDGGYSYTTLLADNVPNNGSHTVTVPNISTYQARFKVKGEGTIFFDITNSNTSIVLNSGIDGCMNSVACNFNPVATNDDGSCEFSPEDVNGNGVIDVGDVLLVLSEFGCVSQCEQDVNGDGFITVADILMLLSSFGETCP